MNSTVQAVSEQSRLQRLYSLDLLDAPAEAAIDAFTALACSVTGMPTALVSLMDHDRQWFASSFGCIPQGSEAPLDVSFCTHAIQSDDIWEVEDALLDDRFCRNPLVVGPPHVVHYAGVPLVMPGGERIGTLCVIGHKPGRLRESDRLLMRGLATTLVGFLIVREKERAQTRAAQEAARAKSEFLATMSHEIRTPINGIIGFAQMLQKSKLPDKETGYVRMLNDCAKTLLELVDDILDLSKIEAGGIVVEQASTDLHALLRSLADLQQVRSMEKGVAFEFFQAPEIPRWVTTDPLRLRQILNNLLSNAWKFTDGGRVSLRVMSESVADGGRQLIFEVKDTGIGISPVVQEKLFVRFSQADASTTRKYKGTGLGLAISRQLTRLLGGDIELTSVPGEGSVFSVHLPLVAAPAPAVSAVDERSAALRREASILVVDDVEVNRLLIEAMLQSHGYVDLVFASNGVEALEACAQRHFDLILMDCQMPVMDGYEATRKLRQKGVATHIIALTASVLQQDKVRCMEAGMTSHMSKPILPEALGSAILALHPTPVVT